MSSLVNLGTRPYTENHAASFLLALLSSQTGNSAQGMDLRYIDIAKRLMAEIRGGQYRPGDLLPSELMLGRHYDVSRSTIRQALSHLQGLGMVSRRRGSGTRIVATEPAPIYVHSMVASGDQLQFAGPSTRHIEFIEHIVADEDLAPKLDQRPGRHWMRIGQTRHVKEASVPVCWTDVYVDYAYADIDPEIRSYPGLVYMLLEERFGIIISRIDQSLKAVGLPQHLSKILVAEPNSHALELTRRYRNVASECEIVAISVLPAGRYSYDLTLSRVSQPISSPGPVDSSD